MGNDKIVYNAGQIAEAMATVTTARHTGEDASKQVEAAYRQVEQTAEGTATQAALDFQRQSEQLRQTIDETVMQLQKAVGTSHENAQNNDARFASIMG
ncbi:hypothetical protein EEB14_22705 [Rhodococcus sp. WS4]|nr:hypothetical protein EEB14_22705 [Rhodococcus sp. WS4]